jgi:hypothetical protein
MIGRPAGRTGLKPLRREINTSLGLDAIPALMAARAAHPELTGAPLRRIVQADPASHAGEYRPWGQARETALAERYRAEIAELEAGYCDVRFRDHADMRAAS